MNEEKILRLEVRLLVKIGKLMSRSRTQVCVFKSILGTVVCCFPPMMIITNIYEVIYHGPGTMINILYN